MMKKTPRWGAQGAFTLLEVMIAVAIIAIALVAVLGSQTQGLSASEISRFNTLAALLAQEKMAEMEALALNDLHSGQGDFGEAFPGYLWRCQVDRVDLAGAETVADQFRRLDLEITLEDREGFRYRVRSYRFFPEWEEGSP